MERESKDEPQHMKKPQRRRLGIRGLQRTYLSYTPPQMKDQPSLQLEEEEEEEEEEKKDLETTHPQRVTPTREHTKRLIEQLEEDVEESTKKEYEQKSPKRQRVVEKEEIPQWSKQTTRAYLKATDPKLDQAFLLTDTFIDHLQKVLQTIFLSKKENEKPPTIDAYMDILYSMLSIEEATNDVLFDFEQQTFIYPYTAFQMLQTNLLQHSEWPGVVFILQPNPLDKKLFNSVASFRFVMRKIFMHFGKNPSF